jgi:hypothetical protein
MEDKDNDEFFDYVRQSHIATNLFQWGKVACIWLLAASLLSGAFAFNSLRKYADSSTAYTQDSLQKGLDEGVLKVNSILDSFDKTAKGLEEDRQRLAPILDNANDLVSTFNKTFTTVNGNLPATFSQVNKTVEQFGTIPATVKEQITKNGDKVYAILEQVEKFETDNLPELGRKINEIADSFNGTGKRIQVLVSDPLIEQDVRFAVQGAALTTFQSQRLVGYLADTMKSVRDLVVDSQQPPKGFWGKVKYSLRFLKDIGGVVYLAVRIINGV